ncbi:MAG: hypothetical protein HFH17_03205 [Ruminococcus sp.]|nr:hypothetical protein [Ruminococcus sp.]
MDHKKRYRLPLVMMLTFLIITGCSAYSRSAPQESSPARETHAAENQQNGQTRQNRQNQHPQNNLSPIPSILSESCRGIFEEAVRTDTTDTLETAARLVERIGESVYPAVDCQNQVNMVNADRAVDFCRQAKAGKQAELTIFSVEYSGGLTQYDLQADAGELSVTRSYYHFEDGELKQKNTCTYPADFWEYTEEGYLLFCGSYFSQEYYIYAVNDVTACTALRVEPLDEEYRQMNRKYILPVGYGLNNLFLTDWNEQDIGQLDVYDLFDKLYPLVRGETVPYRMDENLGVGAVYQIPGEEFEQVIQTYLYIDRETLRSKAVYFPEEGVYEYKPRGLHEAESADVPYPEVTGCRKNSDGTFTLTVNAVYMRNNTSKAFSHEVVIRPLEGERFQYVSNRVIPSQDNFDPVWRRERLTKEQWEEFYGEN